MGGLSDRAVPFLRAVVAEIREENVTFIAGSIAYSAFVSLLPLLLFMLLILSVVGNETLATNAVEMTGSFLAPNARNVLLDALSNASAATGASIVGVLTLLWGTLKIFRGLDTAFSEIYDTEAEDSLPDQIRDGLVVLVAIGVALGAAIAAGAAFAVFENVPFIGVINPLLLVVGLTLAFFPMYYVFPDVDLEPRQVLPGVVFAAVGWTVLQILFQGYAIFADKYAVYGAIGSILVIVTWLYFSGLILLIGAVINAVLVGRAGDGPGGATASEAALLADDSTAGEAHEDAEPEPGTDPGSGAVGTAKAGADADAASDRAELERAYEYLRKAHRNRVREVKELRREREWRRQPIWVRAKWWLLGRPDRAT